MPLAQGSPTTARTDLSHPSASSPAVPARPHSILGHPCRKCNGSGHEGGARPCQSCNGEGWVFTVREQAIMAARGF